MQYINNDGVEVPRVTHILRYINDTESLCKWANFIGLKRKKYIDEIDLYSNIGNYAHEKINLYINNNDVNINNSYPIYIHKMGENAYSGLKIWWDDINKNNDVKVLKSEYSIVGDSYGGTLDALISINNKKYIVDFKTSSKVKINYIIQLVAYINLLKEVDDINDIDGLIIVRSSRNNFEVYEEFLIDINKNIEFINSCNNVFNSALLLHNNFKTCEDYFSKLL